MGIGLPVRQTRASRCSGFQGQPPTLGVDGERVLVLGGGSGVVVREVVEHLLDPDGVGRRERVLVQEPPDVGVAGRVDVDREGREGLERDGDERVIGVAVERLAGGRRGGCFLLRLGGERCRGRGWGNHGECGCGCGGWGGIGGGRILGLLPDIATELSFRARFAEAFFGLKGRHTEFDFALVEVEGVLGEVLLGSSALAAHPWIEPGSACRASGLALSDRARAPLLSRPD